MCPVVECAKVYLYFSSLKKHLSKNHDDYYDTYFNQPSKVEIQTFKRMTAQNFNDEDMPELAESETAQEEFVKHPIGKIE